MCPPRLLELSSALSILSFASILTEKKVFFSESSFIISAKTKSKFPSTPRSEINMPSTIPLKVAIYENPGIKHWSLFIDAADSDNKTIIHLLGARQKYFREVRTRSDAAVSNSLIELCSVCEMDASKLETVKNIAWETPVRNEESNYSCQDFVLEVLERLEDEGIIIDRGDYQRKMETIKAKRESWK